MYVQTNEREVYEMKRLKKFSAIICAIAMLVSSITYYPTSNVSAAATSLPKEVIGLVAVS